MEKKVLSKKLSKLMLPDPKPASDGDMEHMFTIGRDTGSVMVARPLDAEQKSLYNMTISVTDGVHAVTTQVRRYSFVLFIFHLKISNLAGHFSIQVLLSCRCFVFLFSVYYLLCEYFLWTVAT